MKVSIITVVYNNKEHIRECLQSVLFQNYNEIEYLVIDGGSTDGTLEIIKQYEGEISKLVSEKDHGIYDAMNKGLALATGEIIGFLNSDDFYADNNVIAEIAKVFVNNKVDSCFGDLYYVDRRDPSRIVRHWRSRDYKGGDFKYGLYPPHPAFFIKRVVFENYGKFNLNFKISADYELTLRFLEKFKISTYHLPRAIVRMRVGGESNKSNINIIKANYECYKAWKTNGLPFNPFWLLLKPLNKFRQYFYK